MEHTLNVKMFRNGTGFISGCSCGARFGRASGCNRSGLNYALVALHEKFKEHCDKCEATATSIYPECIGEQMLSLAGVRP